ncbi:MAG: hypothetical protein PUD39_00390 [Bacteroidales bacterium]|nr:hypothetical protein [Bacteroidales bacterium]
MTDDCQTMPFTLMALWGEAGHMYWQEPQPMQPSVSTTAMRLPSTFCIVIVDCGQRRAHIPQPMQAAASTWAMPTLYWCFSSTVSRWSAPVGHTSVHLTQL